jgi:uncharacterized protein (TIGR03118 family)
MSAGQRSVWVTLIITAALGCGSSGNGPGFQQTNLVSNLPGKAPVTDGHLLNAWGIAHSSTSPWWVANNGSGTSTLYNGAGSPFPPPPPTPLVVTIPAAASAPPGTLASPTGVVFNSTPDFVVGSEAARGPAQFLFAAEDGTISGWNPNADPTAAILAVDNSEQNAIYKGIALGTTGGVNYLYATNFHAGTVDAFDATFTPALAGSFIDQTIPAGFAPFGIQNIGGDIFVTYAKQDANKEDTVAGAGLGYVNVFDANGSLVRRLVSQGQLNAPWGIAQAPSSFGHFGGAIIVGNFGDGRLNAYDPVGGTFQGQLSFANGDPLAISGLWGLGFGNGSGAGSTNTLYFSAGPNNEVNGLFGMLVPVNS